MTSTASSQKILSYILHQSVLRQQSINISNICSLHVVQRRPGAGNCVNHYLSQCANFLDYKKERQSARLCIVLTG